jgi:hypothetical protein
MDPHPFFLAKSIPEKGMPEDSTDGKSASTSFVMKHSASYPRHKNTVEEQELENRR